MSIEKASYVATLEGASLGQSTISLNGANSSAIVRVLLPEKFKNDELSFKTSCDSSSQLVVYASTEEQNSGLLMNGTDVKLPFKSYDDTMFQLTFVMHNSQANNCNVMIEPLRAEPSSTTSKVAFVELTRKSLPEFFLFDYENLGNGSSSKPLPLNLTAGVLTVMKFEVGSIYDIGGTVTVGLKFTDDRSKEADRSLVVGCLSLGKYIRIFCLIKTHNITIFSCNLQDITRM